MTLRRQIRLRGVEVHNLRGVDLDLPLGRLVVICGLSGSGKTSLALDTLYAEGQRRYLETFSAYSRQFLEQIQRPAALRIEGIPPSIAVTGGQLSRSSRSTLGTLTEVFDHLRLVFARAAQLHCRHCGRTVQFDSPESVLRYLESLPPGRRVMLAYEAPGLLPEQSAQDALAQLQKEGFLRAICRGRVFRLDEPQQRDELARLWAEQAQQQPAAETGTEPHTGVEIVVDRLVTGRLAPGRFHDSCEQAFTQGEGRAVVYVQAEESDPDDWGPVHPVQQQPWHRTLWSNRFRCEYCDCDYPEPDPRLFSFNSPLGACPECEGFGNHLEVDPDLVVPDKRKTLAQGAIAPWTTPAAARDFRRWLRQAPRLGIRTDVPYEELTPEELELVWHGDPEQDFYGIYDFFRYLERKKYKMHVRVFLSRWRSERTCPACQGRRLRPEALAFRIQGHHIADVHAMSVDQAAEFFRQWEPSPWQQQVVRVPLEQVRNRLQYLQTVGLGYLSLDRPLRTLSGGEARRAALTSALGSSLVNMLYVLDEPSIGLHPRDTERLLRAIEQLRDRGNSVVVVEHEEAFLRRADLVVEMGPGAGHLGGQVVFVGTPEQMKQDPDSLTGQYLSGRRCVPAGNVRRGHDQGYLELRGARGHNLKNLTVRFPLGVLCVVTGVSGSGKSSLVQETLYGAVCRELGQSGPKPLPYDELHGTESLDEVILVSQGSLGRTARSNPVTYVKAWDEIRRVFADTPAARARGFSAGHFSFNVRGGRCETCSGEGQIQVDMQFLADVYMTCPECGGQRFRPEVLQVTYRGKTIADVLAMSVREAFSFFRAFPKVLRKLQPLVDVGLDYVPLGQPLSTLSSGEAQRLRLAGLLGTRRRGRCLFLLDEPTTGLHFADVTRLLDCFDALVDQGHSLIVVEHNLHLIAAADYVIDLGPDAADRGGELVVAGTPEEVASCPDSITGRFLQPVLEFQQV